MTVINGNIDLRMPFYERCNTLEQKLFSIFIVMSITPSVERVKNVSVTVKVKNKKFLNRRGLSFFIA